MSWISKLLGDRGGEAQASSLPMIVGKAGSFPTDAVGESHYQTELSALAGGHNRTGHDLDCVAALIPEPGNRYDANAVRVEIEGRLVGYLARADAVRFGDEMTTAGRAGEAAACAARIAGGWRTNQHDAGHFGVRLAIPRRGRFAFA